jgi:hypothetical protein
MRAAAAGGASTTTAVEAGSGSAPLRTFSNDFSKMPQASLDVSNASPKAQSGFKQLEELWNAEGRRVHKGFNYKGEPEGRYGADGALHIKSVTKDGLILEQKVALKAVPHVKYTVANAQGEGVTGEETLVAGKRVIKKSAVSPGSDTKPENK